MDRANHRREKPRLNLGIEAKIMGLDGQQSVVLQDISASGAKVQLAKAEPLSKGILTWLTYEVYADVVWRDGHWCGLKFDNLISNQCLVETRAAAPGLINDARRNKNRHAEDFVSGRSSIS